MHKTRSLVSLLAFTAFAFAAAGCGGGGGGGGTPSIPGPTNNPGPTPPPPPQTLSANGTIQYAGTGKATGITNGSGPEVGNDNGAASSTMNSNGDTCGIIPGSDQSGSIDQTRHHHAFLGVINNGTQAIIPRAIGFVGPGAAPGGFVNTATCLYFTHTHDQSGEIHIEPIVNGPSDFTLADLAAIWGQTISGTQVGPFSGTVYTYVGHASTTQSGDGTFHVNSYTYTADPLSVHLDSHTAIWLIVGSSVSSIPATLPTVGFVTEH